MSQPASFDVAVVIVSWNVWDLLRACLKSIESNSLATDDSHLRRFGPAGRASLQVIVVDNASTDATPDLLRSQFPWVRTILSEENLGFTGGNNLALHHLGVSQPRFVYFLNPDTELLPSSLWTLYHAIAADDRIGAMGPQLLHEDGARQSSRRRFPTHLTGFFESTWLEQLWPANPWTRRYRRADWPDHVRQDVDWLVGAALLVRWQALRQAGHFDERFFMYSEELDLCRRIKQAGWRIVYEPAAIVVHYEGRSSDQADTWRHILFNRSKVLYYRKYFGPIWAELLRRYLLLEFRWQLMLERAKLLVGHRRDLRRARIDTYREVLRNGLHSDQSTGAGMSTN